MIVKIDLADLYIPQGLLPRVVTGTRPEKVEEYAEMIKNGVEFDPILVWKNPKDIKYWIIDGNHRYLAHKKVGKTYIQAKLKDLKNEKDFRKQAIKANLKHGIPLTKEEKMINARLLYQDGTPVDEIALIFGVKERTINNWIKDIIDEKKHQKEELKKKALELYDEGYTQEQIAGKLGVSRQTISYWINTLPKNENFQKLASNPQDLAIQLHNEGLKDEEIQQKILEETGQDIPLKTIKDWIAEYKGKLWDATGWGKSAQTETEEYEEDVEPTEYIEIPEAAKNTIYVSYLKGTSLEEIQEQTREYFKIELTLEQIQQIIEEKEQLSEEEKIDPTTKEIKQIISEMRKKGYNKFQIVKYLVDGEDIDGYTFDQIAKAFDTDTQSIEELYNEALEMGIKTPRPYQKGKAGRKPKDTSTAFDHQAQFEKKIAEAKLFVSSTLANIANTWGQDYAEKALAILRDWINDDEEMHPFTTPLNK
ncbi:helix-turn-helix domain-containing protein [Persephonella sp.]